MRKFIFALLLFIGVAYILVRASEVQGIIETLRSGDWKFIFLAVILEGVWIVNVAGSYQTIYRALGIEEKVENLIPVSVAANFLNIVAPTAGMSGVAMFVAEARRRRYSPARAAVAGALFVLFDYAAFLCVLALGLFVLMRRHDLSGIYIFASGVLLIVAIVMAMMIYLGMRSAKELGDVLSWMARLVNRLLWPFLHREYLPEKRAYAFAHDAAQGLKEVDGDPSKLLAPFFMALCKQGLLILILLLCFLAFKVPLNLGTVIAGFSIGYLFLIISPTPSGLGIVEGAMALTLQSMYVPKADAAILTLAYRGITFWLPLLIGLLAFRWLGGEKSAQVVTPKNSV